MPTQDSQLLLAPRHLKHTAAQEDAARSATQEVKKTRWRWIGHVLRMSPTALRGVALRWTPVGRRKRDRPRETWTRTVEKDMKERGWLWGYLEK